MIRLVQTVRLRELFREHQDALLPVASERVDVQLAVRLAEMLPLQVVPAVVSALRRSDDPEARFWLQRIDPVHWQPPEKIKAFLEQVAWHGIPVALRTAEGIFMEFLDEGLDLHPKREVVEGLTPLGLGQLLGVNVPELLAAYQALFKQPAEVQQRIVELLTVKNPRGRSWPGLVGGIGAFEHSLLGENCYGNALFLIHLGRDRERSQLYKDYYTGREAGEYHDAIRAEKKRFYEAHEWEIVPPGRMRGSARVELLAPMAASFLLPSLLSTNPRLVGSFCLVLLGLMIVAANSQFGQTASVRLQPALRRAA